MIVGVDVGGTVSTVSIVLGALVAVLGVVGYQNRRAKLSTVRSAFNDAVTALAAEDSERRLAGAILLRRFFDRTSELGIRDALGRRRAPYETEAQSVMAAVLRELPAGDLQKLLADGLAHARTLERADLQRTNLQGAYLAPRHPHGSLDRADFYRADLSGASLKGAHAHEAIFYQARLQDTILRDAELLDANFFEADLARAVFTGARLHGADFSSARNVPPEIAASIGSDGRYTSTDRAPAPQRPESGAPGRVFLSLPSQRTPAQDAFRERLVSLLAQHGLVMETLARGDYPTSSALGEIHRRLSGCTGAIVFGLQATDATAAPAAVSGATPWTHLEAGMAYGCGLPLLIVREDGVRAGAFDEVVVGHRTFVVDVGDAWDEPRVRNAIGPWLFEMSR